MDPFNSLFDDDLREDVSGMTCASGSNVTVAWEADLLSLLRNGPDTPSDSTTLHPSESVDLRSVRDCGSHLPARAAVPGPKQACDDSKRQLLKEQNRVKQARYREKLKVRALSFWIFCDRW